MHWLGYHKRLITETVSPLCSRIQNSMSLCAIDSLPFSLNLGQEYMKDYPLQYYSAHQLRPASQALLSVPLPSEVWWVVTISLEFF